MNKKELIASLSEQSGLTKREVGRLLLNFSKTLTDTLTKGEKVTLTGFGTFVISQRKGRIGINPQNPKEKIKISPSVTVHFRASKKLKSKMG